MGYPPCAEPSALDACADLAPRGAPLVSVEKGKAEPALRFGGAASATQERPFVATYLGFNIHAGTAVRADDDEGRETLGRYITRPPVALERFERLRDGRIAFKVKYATATGGTHRVMTPLALMARLAAIVPPSRFPTLTYHGVLAPNSPWRKLVVPQPPAAVAGLERACPAKESTARSQDALVANGDTASLPPTPPVAPAKMGGPAPAGPAASRPLSDRAPDRASTGRERRTPGSPAPGASALPELIMLTPSVLSVRRWGRIGEGLRLATSPRVDWATLLKRSLDVDALKCPKCSGRLRILAAVTNASEAKRILAPLGPRTAAPRPARAQDPTDDFVDVEVESWADG